MTVENGPTVIETLFEQVADYGKTRAELLKLKVTDNASEFVSSAAARLAVYLIASRTILFCGLATAFFLGEWLERYSYGFFIVTIVFALGGILVHLLRNRWIKGPVARLVITKILG